MLDNIQIMGKVTLKELRKLTGLSQKEFAQKVNIPFTTYRRYENNPESMEAGRLFKLCDILGVSISNIKIV
jgi:transcriptional regulator with XRE-family HTH domain